MTALFAAVLGWNDLMVGGPVRRELSGDPRNAGLTLRAHYAYYATPGTLVLDLRDVESAAPVDLLRVVFQSADVLTARGREFDQVVLARSGTPVFTMDGSEFAAVGRAFAGGENPVYLIRSFPEKLRRPDGSQPYGTWTGGLLGVLGRQMEDVSSASRAWMNGGDPGS